MTDTELWVKNSRPDVPNPYTMDLDNYDIEEYLQCPLCGKDVPESLAKIHENICQANSLAESYLAELKDMTEELKDMTESAEQPSLEQKLSTSNAEVNETDEVLNQEN